MRSGSDSGLPRERSRFEREMSALGLVPDEREVSYESEVAGGTQIGFDPIAAARRNRTYAYALGWRSRAGDILRLAAGGTQPAPSFTHAVAGWQRRQGMPADGVVGPRTWSAMQRALARGPSREFEREGDDTPRLSKGALGAAFAATQDSAGVPEEAVRRVITSPAFRAMAVNIDKAYAAVETLSSAGTAVDVGADGRVTKPAGLKGRRLLFVQSGGFTGLRRAFSVDNSGRADIADVSAPDKGITGAAEELLVKDWIVRIVWMAAQIEAEAKVDRRTSIALAKRIANCVEALRVARVHTDDVFKELDKSAKPDDLKFGTMFGAFNRTQFVEIAYYPADLLLKGQFLLTNLEHCALAEQMEEAIRAEKLKDPALAEMKAKLDKITFSGDDDLAKRLESPFPIVVNDATKKDETIASKFASLYFGRRILDGRWKSLNPGEKDDWKKDADVRERRDEHARAFLAGIVKYRVNP